MGPERRCQICVTCTSEAAAMTQGLHILGASGSGTTTLGAALAKRLAMQHLDTDDFLWYPTEPKFQQTRPAAERLRLLDRAMDRATAGWVLSGSLAGWGDPWVDRFDLALFLSLPAD